MSTGRQTLAEPLLLDTHAWLWLVDGRQDLDAAVVVRLERAAEFSLLQLAAVSIWEVGFLEARGLLRFDIPCDEWVVRALEAPGLQIVPLSPTIALQSSRLPGRFSGDVADRIIVATARNTGAPLVTRDPHMVSYADQGYLSTVVL